MMPGPLADMRRRQIDTLKIFNNNVTEIKAGSEYTIGFMSEDRQMLLDVLLGVNFPNEKPKFVITPRVQHEWIPDPAIGEILSAPGVLNFTVHSDLGRVAQAIIREFERFPPPLWPNTGSGPSLPQTVLPYPTELNKSSIPELCNLSMEELRKLEQDQQHLNDFVDEMSVVKRIQKDLDRLIEDNKGLATENLSHETHINELRCRVTEKLDEFREIAASYEALNSRYQDKSQEFAPQHIKELLQIAVSNADTACDSIVEKFLSKEIDVQQFLDQYREAKKLSAMRKAKEERLTHQLNELERAQF